MNDGLVIAAVALGSNMGDRQGHIAHAFAALGRLERTRVVARGPVVETEAVGMPGVEAGGAYLNSAVFIETSLTPRALLDALHAIERERGRRRGGEGGSEQRWGPRTLDLDLLVYGDRVVQEPGLTVPHPRMHERRFVLEPLAAIAPGMVVPGQGTVGGLLAALTTRGGV